MLEQERDARSILMVAECDVDGEKKKSPQQTSPDPVFISLQLALLHIFRLRISPIITMSR